MQNSNGSTKRKGWYKKCPCGRKFYVAPCNKDKKFCGMQCYANSMKKPLPKTTCAHCGKAIFVPKRDYERAQKASGKNFCNRDCLHAHAKGKNAFAYKGKEKKCRQCGKKYLVHKSRYLKSRGVKYRTGEMFCSPKCQQKYKVKENSANWFGGKSFEPYGIEFDEKLRETVRERDGRKCMKCKCLEKNLNRRLACHHINYDKNDNRMENLISLCVNCHVPTNVNRDKWTERFTIILKDKYNYELQER